MGLDFEIVLWYKESGSGFGPLFAVLRPFLGSVDLGLNDFLNFKDLGNREVLKLWISGGFNREPLSTLVF